MHVLRPLLVTLVVLGGLFVAADRIAVAVAESQVADRVQQSQRLTGKPDVDIKGFPFLTQVLAGNLRNVRASTDGVKADNGGRASLRMAGLTADLHDVRLSNGFSTAVADTVTGTAQISYRDLSDVAPPGVSVGYAGKDSRTGAGRVKVTASVSILGQTWKGGVVSTVSVPGGDTVRLHAQELPGVSTIPGLERMLRERIDFDQRVVGLPSGIRLAGVDSGPDGFTLSLTGRDVRLTG